MSVFFCTYVRRCNCNLLVVQMRTPPDTYPANTCLGPCILQGCRKMHRKWKLREHDVSLPVNQANSYVNLPDIELCTITFLLVIVLATEQSEL